MTQPVFGQRDKNREAGPRAVVFLVTRRIANDGNEVESIPAAKITKLPKKRKKSTRHSMHLTRDFTSVEQTCWNESLLEQICEQQLAF